MGFSDLIIYYYLIIRILDFRLQISDLNFENIKTIFVSNNKFYFVFKKFINCAIAIPRWLMAPFSSRESCAKVAS